MFSNMLYGKKRKARVLEINRKLSKLKTPIVLGLALLENSWKANDLLPKHDFGFNEQKSHFTAIMVNAYW